MVLVLFVFDPVLLATRRSGGDGRSPSESGSTRWDPPSRFAALGPLLRQPDAGWARRAPRPAHALIQGSGSTWAANAVNQWVADVSPGAAGRLHPNRCGTGPQDFANARPTSGSPTRLSGRRPGYRSHDTVAGPARTPTCRSSAGGTSFPYQVKVPASWCATCGCPARR